MHRNYINGEQPSVREGPAWLEKFLMGNYFDPCKEHKFNKNEKNHFCIDCIDGPLCSRGLLSHSGHRTLQVRKASHADGVRVENVYKLLDISGIQTYIINNHKIVFLLRQAKGKLIAKGSTTRNCQTCGRVLSDSVRFCSIKCKLIAVQTGIGGSSVSLSPEAKSVVAGGVKVFHFQNHGLMPLEKLSIPSYTKVDDFENSPLGTQKVTGSPDALELEMDLSQLQGKAINQAWEAKQGKRKIEMAFNTSYNEKLNNLGPVLSPVSVLHVMGPSTGFSLGHPVARSPTSTSELNHLNFHHPSPMPMPGFGDDQSAMQLEVELIRRMLLAASYRRKSRKGSPHRAPLW